MACYIYQLPAWVLDDLCRNMDTLSEWDWMQFASYVITDLTQLRKIKSMERVQGVSITRELLWWWGMRQATVQQLVDLLCRLELYRAAHIVLSYNGGLLFWGEDSIVRWNVEQLRHFTIKICEGLYESDTDSTAPNNNNNNLHFTGKPVSESTSRPPTFPEAGKPGPPAASVRPAENGHSEGQPLRLDPFPGPGSAATRAHLQASHLLPPHKDAPGSLETSLPDSSDAKGVRTSVPQQEKLLSLPKDDLFWSEADVVQATNDFAQSHRLSEGTFADVYRGQRHGMPVVFKKLKKTACSSPGHVERYFQAEAQICLRCCHPNILPLLGFCIGSQFHGLIYPYMANGSLQDRLQDHGGLDPLPWPQRAVICSGLLRAVEHLHRLEIIHSNVKSSNILLDQNFTPRLAHPMAHQCPMDQRLKYTMMKTHLFQASAAYLPEDFIRVGQLTKRVDVFSCGIVLAEVLTGIPAMDKDRSPVYLKDLLLSEIPSSTTTSLCSKKTGAEKAMAKEICWKYLEKRAGPLPEDCAEAWATAVCLCLRRRNASLEEALGAVAAVEERLQGQLSLPWSELSERTGLSSNTPEETDDVDNSSLDTSSSSMGEAPCAGAAAAVSVPTESGATELRGSRGAEASLQPAKDSTETSWKIEINEAKRKLMENILLYTEEKLDSTELFGP